MVFPSIPVYLDPPNWNQQLQAHHIVQQGSSAAIGSGGGGGGNGAFPPLPVGAASHALRQEAPPSMPGGAARPGSMSERARLAKLPQPEQALKCPRCDSTNTKFCYYNNYSLTQPRHFCKTCRRYWTRGGALRNVPVGGGCRRNKRSSKSGGGGSSSKSSAATAATDRRTTAGASSSTASSTAATSAAGMAGAIPSNINIPLPHQLPFMASLHHPFSGPDHYSTAPNLGLTFPGIQHMEGIDYHVGGGGFDQWRVPQQMHQFPFIGGLEPPPPPPTGSAASAGMFFHLDLESGSGVEGGGGFARQMAAAKVLGSGIIANLASVKMEENPRAGQGVPRQFMGTTAGRNDSSMWGGGVGGGGGGGSGEGGGGGGWAADLAGFNSSSAGNLL